MYKWLHVNHRFFYQISWMQNLMFDAENHYCFPFLKSWFRGWIKQKLGKKSGKTKVCDIVAWLRSNTKTVQKCSIGLRKIFVRYPCMCELMFHTRTTHVLHAPFLSGKNQAKSTWHHRMTETRYIFLLNFKYVLNREEKLLCMICNIEEDFLIVISR